MNLISHKYRYILRTFRKSGCSTLRNLFLNLHWEELELSNSPTKDDYHSTLQNCINHYNNYAPDTVFEKYKDYHKIYVIRNSYERVVSMYFNRWLDIPDFNSLSSGDKSKEWYLSREMQPETFNWFLNRLEEDSLVDEHYSSQEMIGIDDNSFVINLNDMNVILPDIYKDVIKFANIEMIKNILNDKKEVSKTRDLSGYGKLDNYNFKEDIHNFNIMKNGIPNKNQMITEENAKLIKHLYMDEITLHNFDYKHLL